VNVRVTTSVFAEQSGFAGTRKRADVRARIHCAWIPGYSYKATGAAQVNWE